MQRQLGIHMKKNEIRYLPRNIHKNKFQMSRYLDVSRAKL